MQVLGQGVDHLDHQIENSLERLEELWRCTGKLPLPQQQALVAVLEQLSQTLQELQFLSEELHALNEQLSVTRLVMETDRQQLKQTIAEHQQLEAQLLSKTERERLFQSVQEYIYRSVALEKIFNIAVAETQKILKCDRVVIYRVSDREAIAEAEAVAADRKSILGTNICNSCLTTQTSPYYWEKNCVINEIDLDSFSTDIQNSIWEQELKACVSIPIRQGGRIWGLLAVHQCSNVRNWQSEEIDLLTALAMQQAIAIQQAELSQQLQKLHEELQQKESDRTEQLQQALKFEAMLKRITDKVRDSLDESQILQTAVRELVLILGLKGCDAAIYNVGQNKSTISYEYTPDMPAAKGDIVKMSEFPEGYQQLLQGQYFQFCELIPTRRGSLAILACPIVDNQGSLGDLWLFKEREDGFNELEIRLVQQVANQCAIAIRQARLYQTAQAQVTELEKLNRLKDEFLSTVSHELRTPVSNMKMAIQMLAVTLNREQPFLAELDKPQDQQSKLARYFQILQNECEREIALINDVLDLERIELDGVQQLVLVAIDLTNWLPQIVTPFQARAQKRQQILQLYIPDSLPHLLCDRTSLERILSELLNNACKYAPPGERITVTAQTQGENIQISVSNTGVEIEPGQISRIFEKFYRIPSADPWKQGGTGLGLALVQKLTTHLGGTIHVQSENNLTCFTITLPLDNSSDG